MNPDTEFFRQLGIEMVEPKRPSRWRRAALWLFAFALGVGFWWLIIWGAVEGYKYL
jgi:hypothetical protein